MTTCPACAKSVPADALSCPGCGAALVNSWTPTRHRNIAPRVKHIDGDDRRDPSPHVVTSATSTGNGRFIAGVIVAERYRIISLLGRGGMGEVYKAEDLKLDQTVALKFLPESFARDQAALARFRNEVRITRQISHPNVCRVYDIGEVDGRTFLSMEFIDGEDLSSLLRRIGRLPGDKATEIARQICAGLAAAHDNGVLHRDLKPANIMIDGRGKARVTDFGIAVAAQEVQGDGVIAGTPTYMAPEQLSGKEVTEQSDIYALGLVLYELFTGKRVFEESSVSNLLKLHDQSTPTTPSSHVKNIDPVVEKIILRCLEKDLKKRPASAIQVAAALPGGDPLQAALALGETPSPEMVAAAGEKTGLRPATAVTLLAAIVMAIGIYALVSNRGDIRVRLFRDRSPEELAHGARDLISRLGYSERPFDSDYAFRADLDLLQYVRRTSQSEVSWMELINGRPAPAYFWYRESPQYLEIKGWDGGGDVTEDNPPPIESGMRTVKFDPSGRLLSFTAIPPQLDQNGAVSSSPDWSLLFAAARLDFSRFTSSGPIRTSLGTSDLRAAWTGASDDLPNVPLRIEAAAYRGKPVYFEVIAPWTRPERAERLQVTTAQKIGSAIFSVVVLVAAAGAALLARYNIRAGRGDRRGAIRLASFVFVIGLLSWLVGSRHSLMGNELPSFVFIGLGLSLVLAGLIWVLYLALEPYVRRRWPQAMISWSRMLNGSLRDPLVGRDVLIGALVGIGMALVFPVANLFQFQRHTMPPSPGDLHTFLGGRHLVAVIPLGLCITILIALIQFFVLFLLRVVLRKQWLATGFFVLIFVTANVLSSTDPPVVAVSMLVFFAGFIFVLMRFGFLAATANFLSSWLLTIVPITTDLSAWYAGSSIAVVVLVLAIAGFAFHTSLGGQKGFVGKLLEAEE